MEIGSVPEKMDEYFHWGPMLYVCNSARNWVLVMYKGTVYIIYVIPFGEQQPWMSEVPKTFQQKKIGPPK